VLVGVYWCDFSFRGVGDGVFWGIGTLCGSDLSNRRRWVRKVRKADHVEVKIERGLHRKTTNVTKTTKG